jgi:Holliday junction DNA helicase RuvA
MLAYIQGALLIKSSDHIIVVLPDGLGYKVFLTAGSLASLMIGDQVRLFLYHQIKEDGQALFGFTDLETLEFFELLLTVSGIGPKSALNILSATDVGNLAQAIGLGEPELLTKVSGIGKKMAEKIVVELKSKLKNFAFTSAMSSAPAADELEALVGLGYSLASARQALEQVGRDVDDSGERIREALKLLAK